MATPTTGAVDSAITETFDYVFFEGLGGFSAEVPFPWPISIGGRPFVIDLSHYAWTLPDMVRQAIDFSASPGEQSFDTGGVWLRSAGDWSIGAGQEYHDAADAVQRMFAESLGIDVWTKRQIELLPATEEWHSSPGVQVLRLLPHGQYLYMLEGAVEGPGALGRMTDVQVETVFPEFITGLPTEPLADITTDGGLIYVATESGIYTHDPAGTTAAVYGGAASTTVANVLRYASGWLLAGVDNVISSIDNAGALTAVHEHPVLAFRYAAIVGTPAGIYFGGQGDDVAEILHVAVDDTGGLGVAVHAAELPRGEQLRSLAYYGSVVLVGTSKGLRIGQINGDVNATLDIGPLIETSTDVLCAFGDSKFVWFGWSDYDATHTGVGRANLAEFRSRQQPAYASDLMMSGQQGAVTDVCRFNGHTYFAVAEVGFFREQWEGHVEPAGTIRLGKYEWGTFEPKTFLGLQLITRPLHGTVSATLTDDADNVVFLGTLSIQGSTCMGQLLGAGLGGLSTFFDLELTLTREEVLV